MAEYRIAQHTDLDQLTAMAGDATQKAYPALPFDAKVARQSLTEAIESVDSIVIVAEETCGLVGFVVGQVVLSWFGDGRVAKDWITYSAPGSHPWIFYNLHKRYVAWAFDVGADNLITSNFSGRSDRAMRKVLTRLGYTPSGTMAQQATY